MHIVGIVLAVIAAIGVWYFRYQQSREVIHDAADAIGRAKGAYNRKKFRDKARDSVLTGIDDPILAVAVLLVGIAEADNPMTRETEDGIKAVLQKNTGATSPEEHLAFAKWACREVPDINNVIRRLVPLLNSKLDDDEKRDVIEMANQTIKLSGGPGVAGAAAVLRLQNGLNINT